MLDEPPEIRRRCYTLTEVCVLTGASSETLSNEIKNGRLVAHKWGRRTVILSDDLHRFLAALPLLPRLGEEGAQNEAV
jgi:excisionase family DNA binding protein